MSDPKPSAHAVVTTEPKIVLEKNDNQQFQAQILQLLRDLGNRITGLEDKISLVQVLSKSQKETQPDSDEHFDRVSDEASLAASPQEPADHIDETESEQPSSCEDGELKVTISGLPADYRTSAQVPNSTKLVEVIELD